MVGLTRRAPVEHTEQLRLVQPVEDWLTEEVGIGGNQAVGGAIR